MIKVRYTKYFLDGTLKGMTYEASISMPNLEHAVAVVGLMNKQQTEQTVLESMEGTHYQILNSKIEA